MALAINTTTGSKTLLVLVQDICDEIGLPRPITVTGSVDQQVRQMLALINLEGKALASLGQNLGGWPQLRKEFTITTVSGQAAYAFPTDVAFFIPSTVWDRTYRWQLLGPLNPQEWQVLKSGISPTGPRRRFRIMGGQIYLDPTPSSADAATIALEYISVNWVNSSAAVGKTAFTADDDYTVLDQDVIAAGLKWRFLRAKGLDYGEEKQHYENLRNQSVARSGGLRDIPMNASASGMRLLNNMNVPDTGFGT